ncbi:amino acid permease [Treponema phagedenis]|uniref:Amino acid permease n=1 Tax=Treponema phagedenis TaxID=162 RepID=A0A0B7GTE5_TREPH|nr:amino acid permease [Treponema phagedenis]NVP22789.1 amino acid permease [Treponema phagedenis]QEJ95257.1 amino acid permease [Treponema phagedenis]QEJ98360.1 amino acid permease [Treponema phagedenis]QEK03870.1 amino acid permease [Treponema phagedenis]QEK09485.1 amino acid permease [Treponema phagedenis]
MEKNNKQILWYNLAFMAFSTVWGFGNVVNGFVYFNGVQAIFSWLLMFGLYFVPYALMVGELGSTFKTEGGGVSSWIQNTTTNKLAYYAGWTYWVVHMPYIAAKASGGLKALSWVVFQNSSLYDGLDIRLVQCITLAVFLFFSYVASRGLNPLKILATVAGTSMFVMSILFILLMMAAPVINPNGGYQQIDWSIGNFIPNFRFEYFTSLSILVFAVGGCEKISPYVNKVKDPAKGFPKGMIFLAIMVIVCAILGSISLGRMFDVNEINANFDSYVSNGAYWSFQKLGNYYGIGNTFMIIYALCNMVGQLSTLVVSIDAPLRMLLDSDTAKDYIPHALLKKNKKGAYINGIWLVVAIVTPLIIIPMLGIKSVTAFLRFLTQLNSVCMPLRYLWVFAAYIALRKSMDKFQSEYKFVKNQAIAKFFGVWCFFVTAFSCTLGMFKGSPFEITMNIITPIALVGLGAIMPLLAKRNKLTVSAE